MSSTKPAQPAIVGQLKAARKAGVPLVAVTTPDPGATIEAIAGSFNEPPPIVCWDVCTGARGRNEAGKVAVAQMSGDGGGGDFDPTVGNPAELARRALSLPDRTLLFMHLANRWIQDPGVVQGVWNLRDAFKTNHRTLVMLGPSIDLPAELAGDVVVFDEPLPDAAALAGILDEQFTGAKVKPKGDVVARAVEALQGLPAFQAEQVVAMSLTPCGSSGTTRWPGCSPPARARSAARRTSSRRRRGSGRPTCRPAAAQCSDRSRSAATRLRRSWRG